MSVNVQQPEEVARGKLREALIATIKIGCCEIARREIELAMMRLELNLRVLDQPPPGAAGEGEAPR